MSEIGEIPITMTSTITKEPVMPPAGSADHDRTASHKVDVEQPETLDGVLSEVVNSFKEWISGLSGEDREKLVEALSALGEAAVLNGDELPDEEDKYVLIVEHERLLSVLKLIFLIIKIMVEGNKDVITGQELVKYLGDEPLSGRSENRILSKLSGDDDNDEKESWDSFKDEVQGSGEIRSDAVMGVILSAYRNNSFENYRLKKVNKAKRSKFFSRVKNLLSPKKANFALAA